MFVLLHINMFVLLDMSTQCSAFHRCSSFNMFPCNSLPYACSKWSLSGGCSICGSDVFYLRLYDSRLCNTHSTITTTTTTTTTTNNKFRNCCCKWNELAEVGAGTKSDGAPGASCGRYYEY